MFQCLGASATQAWRRACQVLRTRTTITPCLIGGSRCYRRPRRRVIAQPRLVLRRSNYSPANSTAWWCGSPTAKGRARSASSARIRRTRSRSSVHGRSFQTGRVSSSLPSPVGGPAPAELVLRCAFKFRRGLAQLSRSWAGPSTRKAAIRGVTLRRLPVGSWEAEAARRSTSTCHRRRYSESRRWGRGQWNWPALLSRRSRTRGVSSPGR